MPAMSRLPFQSPTRRSPARGLRARLEDMSRREDANAAIEFAFVAFPFFLLLIGIFEICLIFVVSTVLNFGAQEAARDIRTGNFQTHATEAKTAAQFETNICGGMANLFDCDTKLMVDVRTVTNFPTLQDAVPLNGDGSLDSSGFGFDPGQRDEIVIVNVYYEWSLITPMISKYLANLPGDKRLIVSSQAFRNEPF